MLGGEAALYSYTVTELVRPPQLITVHRLPGHAPPREHPPNSCKLCLRGAEGGKKHALLALSEECVFLARPRRY